jgi:hypothetical protein
MARLIVICAVASCGGSPPPAPPSNSTGSLTITGKVTDREGRAPLEGVTVIVNPAGRWAMTEGRPPEGEKPLADTLTDATGVYKIAKLPAGRYDVRFYYADIVAHRVVDVRKPTVVDQEIDGGWTGTGEQRHCADATAASCK